MATTIDLRGILKPNLLSPIFASNYREGDRPSGGGDWQLANGYFEGYMAPVISYPRPDSETAVNSRHRVNYTGQDYRVPVAVSGGAWPFYYELLSGPEGMTIGSQLTLVDGELVADDNYGVINWPNSVAGTYTISVRVIDQNGVINTVSWQLVVGTADWIFFDPTAVTNGTGTLASPYNTLASFSGLTTKKVLYRAGTVDLEQKTIGLDAWPKVHMPYNNEAVIMNKAFSSVGCENTGDIWFSGITFHAPSAKNIVTEYNQLFALGSATRTVFFENTFDYENLSNPNGSGSNSAVIMWKQASVPQSNVNQGWYCVLMRNAFKNIVDRDMYLGYSMRYAVVERNSMQNCTTSGQGHGFYAKDSVDYFTFRGNYSIGTTNTQKLLRVDAYSSNYINDYYDISYNNYRFYGTDTSGDGTGAISFSHQFDPAGTHHYVFRNSLWSQNAGAIHARGQTSTSGISASNNVMVSGGTNTNGIRLVAYDGAFSNIGFLAGNLASGILDSNNKLGSAYLSNLGTKGAQVANAAQVGILSITGSGFGTKATGTPYFDNFESRTVGAANSASLGGASELAISNPQHVSIIDSGAHSGTKAVQMNYAAASIAAGGDPSSNLLFPKIYHEFATRTRYGYGAFWIKYSGSNSSNQNVWKLSRFSSDSVDPYSGTNLITYQYTSASGSSRPQNYSGLSAGSVTPLQYLATTPDTINPSTEVPVYNAATTFAKDVWHLYEVEFDVGTLNTANAIAEERWDKTLTVRHGNGTNSMTFKTTANPNDVYSLMTPMCGLDNYSNITMLMDEAYVDGSRCRVVMTDTATYSSWTKWAIQPILSYSDTNITVKKHKGMFTVGDTAYLHVFNSSGVRVHTSGAITVTEDNA